MSNDNENSLGDQNTFDGGDDQFDPHSLGDEGTFAGGGGYDPQSLGDEMTFGGGANDADDSFVDGMEVVDLEARYRIEGTLGKGGMGEVLLATDTRLERKVAIKRILGTAARSKTAVSRFLTEAKSVAALNHQNIVQIYDYGRAKDGPFLIMEYVEGESLLDKCRQGPIELEEAVNLTCQLCEGLAKAHSANIIHRDIKPANVLMTPDGVPKLTDFGLAKDDAADTGMTMAGAVIGTLDFMPPEQRKDAALTDSRSDLWSLAASLYQMVTGKSPKIIKFNDVPAALQDVLARALEDEKDDRYQTALEFRDALRECLTADGPDLSELDTGQCPACGTKNDSSRRFCRNPDCGESLEAPCLSCDSQIPMWEAVCGSCGAKQELLVEEAKERKQGERIQAEELVELLDFKKARKLSENLKSETDPRLQQQVKWATEFQDVIESRYQSEMQRVSQLQSEAMQHEKSFDYGAAIRTLRQVPETLIYDEASGFEENVADTVQRLEKIENHCKDLEKKIKRSIQARQLDGLIPLVDELRGLLPQREDLGKLKQQLIARDEKLERVRRESFAEAMEAFESQDYLACLASLKKIDSTLIDDEVRELQEQAVISSSRVKELDQQITAATLKKQFDGLLEAVEEYLFLQEAHTERQKLRDQLIQRKEKQLAQVETLTKSATQLRNTGKHEAALSKLQQIPDFLRSDQVKSLESSCNELNYAKQQADAALARARSSGQYGKEIPIALSYHMLLRQHPSIEDSDFKQLYSQAKEILDKQNRRHNAAKKLKNHAFYGGIFAACILFLGITLSALSIINRFDDTITNSTTPPPNASVSNPDKVIPPVVNGDSDQTSETTEVVESETIGYELVQDEQLLFVPPYGTDTTSIPLSLLPPGPAVIVSCRLGDFVDHPLGENLLTGVSTGADRLVEQAVTRSKMPVESIDRLIITMFPGESGWPEVALAVHLAEPIQESQLIETLAVEQARTRENKQIYIGDQDDSDAYYWNATEGEETVSVYAIGTVPRISEVAGLDGSDIPLPRTSQALWADTSVDSDLVVLFTPNFLFTDGREMLKAAAPEFIAPLKRFMQPDINACLFTLYFNTDETVFLETRYAPSGGISDPALLKKVTDSFVALPAWANNFILHSEQDPSWKLLAIRMPQMMQYLSSKTRVGISDNAVVANTYLPQAAFPQLAFAGLLAMNTSTTGVAIEITPEAEMLTIDQMLDRKMSVSFDQESLEFALEAISNAFQEGLPAGNEMPTAVIVGGDLELMGITQNQQLRDFSKTDKALRDVLTALVVQANPDKSATGPDDPKQSLIWVVIDSEEGGKEIRITTRQAAERESYQVPPEFVGGE